jgi:hypothetical protein
MTMVLKKIKIKKGHRRYRAHIKGYQSQKAGVTISLFHIEQDRS